MFSRTVALLKRDYWGLKGNTLLLVVVILFPVSLGLMFGTFNNIIPKSAPSAVFPESGASVEDVRAAASIVSLFSNPTIKSAFDENGLFREEYYFLVGVPPGFRQDPRGVSVYVDSSLSPVSELSPYVKDMILYGLSRNSGFEPEIDVVGVGRQALPFQYFIPGLLVLLSACVGFLVIPFQLSQDRRVLRRVLAAVPTPSFVSGKLFFAVVLVLSQGALLSLAQLSTGTPESALILIGPWTLFTLTIATVFFASLGTAVMFLTRFGEAGKQLNAGFLGATLLFSGAIYPVGFFPDIFMFGGALQALGRANPSYLFVVLTRGFGLRGLGPEIFSDYIAMALLWTALSVVLLHVAAERWKDG